MSDLDRFRPLEPTHPELRPRGEGSLLRDLTFLTTGVVLGIGAMVAIGYRPRARPATILAASRGAVVPAVAPTGSVDALGVPASGAMMPPLTADLPPPGTTVVPMPVTGAAGAGTPAMSAAMASAPVPAAPALASPNPATPGDAAAFPRPLPLLIPVQGVAPDKLVDTFAQARAAGQRHHDAIDIMAPEGTPVMAADDGVLSKLFTSKDGGLTLYQTAPGGRAVYYYAHLSAYAANLVEGQPLERGRALGFVGHTGNASPDAPHLHFAVYDLEPGQKWWQGRARNPYPLLTTSSSSTPPSSASP